MNKYDRILIVVLLIISAIALIILNINSKKGKYALVYYNGNEILKVDLSITSKKTYQVNGFNGLIELESVDGKIRVVEETSPLHLCSKQGYISKSYETITCLPNKVIIKIISNDNELDTVIG